MMGRLVEALNALWTEFSLKRATINQNRVGNTAMPIEKPDPVCNTRREAAGIE
jgi:hypothetical protein